MKLKDGFVKKLIMDEYVVVPTGESLSSFSGLIKLNETGSYIWDKLAEGYDEHMIVKDLSSDYQIDLDTAKKDVSDFLSKIKDAGCIED